MRRKLIFVITFAVLLLARYAICGTGYGKQSLPQQQISEDELSFEQTDFYYHNEGDIPAPQIFFNSFPSINNLFPSSEKARKTVHNLYYSQIQIIYKLSHIQASIFSWHSSALIHLFLKTACFRL